MAKKGYKRLTLKEKKWNKEIREQLRAEGVLPPKKKPLNRDKFAREVLSDYEEFNLLEDFHYLQMAVGCMTPFVVDGIRTEVSPEHVGVLKLLKIAMDLKKFEKELSDVGRLSYTAKEFTEVVQPIIKL